MVAIISGSELGLFNAIPGGAFGTGGAGNTSERINVNSATGNLIIRNTDDYLSSLGLDLALVRTYNSQGLLDDDNSDNWRLGVEQSVHGLTGWRNWYGTITKTFGDGTAENAIRPFVIGRKNRLFSASQSGVNASANLYSLIETAKANNPEP